MQLEPIKITETIERLKLRIEERFPGSGLARVCDRLLYRARETEEVVERLGTPIWPIRAVSLLVILAFVASLLVLVLSHRIEEGASMSAVVQTLDAGGNVLLLLGLTSVFLWSWETKVRRRRAIVAINRLRDLAHVVDMKQLTKDPAVVTGFDLKTASSPARILDAFLLGRYLDYCSECLSLISKLGYLYVARFQDPVATDAVNELEGLCTGLSRKVWQKIMILRAERGLAATSAAPAAADRAPRPSSER
ncbi:MAG: hypothetical protein R3F30_07240 [Planctomycetota bacterium]